MKNKSFFNWLLNARIYQVLIDRYAGCKEEYSIDELKKGFLYGNIKSLITKLDYIKSLNFNMIWLSPFFINQPNGYHGYHAINLNHVDPRFAFGEKAPDNDIGDVFNSYDVQKETAADLILKDFIGECHKRNIFVMMDIIPNHVYKTHPFFVDALNNINSKYRNWFYFLDNPKNKYVPYLTFLSFGDLPKLNLENNDCLNHIVQSTNKFLSYGIDAIRVDHCIGPSLNSLKKLVNEIHKSFPDVPFIGECFPIGIAKDYENIFGITKEKLLLTNNNNLKALKDLDDDFLSFVNVLDGVLDFTFHILIEKFAENQISEDECIMEIEKHFERFSKYKEFILIKNIDSHDSNRILYKCNNNMSKFKKAMDLLYKKYKDRNDPLIVYYGTEDFMTQDKSIFGEPYGDFRCRQPMKFHSQWVKSFFKDKK